MQTFVVWQVRSVCNTLLYKSMEDPVPQLTVAKQSLKIPFCFDKALPSAPPNH